MVRLKRALIAGCTGLVLIASIGPPVAAQTTETGFLNRAVVVDGAEYRYQVYVPRTFTRSTKWPIVLALHGGGNDGDDGVTQTTGGLANAVRWNADRFPAIVVFPQAHADGTPGWQGASGRAALAAVDKAIAEFSGDAARIYLTGFSAGGNGAWHLASHHPDRFAAALVICGFISEFRGTTSGVLYPALMPSSEPDPYAAMAKRVAHLPTWIFHGDADPTVPVEESRKMAAALDAIGADVRYTELPGVDHNAWVPAYRRADVIEWLLAQRLQ